MKNVVTISSIQFGNPFDNERGMRIQPVNISVVERVDQFKYNDDEEKELKHVRVIPNINLSDFIRMLALEPWLALVPETKVPEEVTDAKEQLAIRFEDHVRLLKAAKVSFEREEIKEVEYDETKPLLNEDGEPKRNEEGDILYEPKLDNEGKPVKKLIGFGETVFTKVELSTPSLKLAENLAYNKK